MTLASFDHLESFYNRVVSLRVATAPLEIGSDESGAGDYQTFTNVGIRKLACQMTDLVLKTTLKLINTSIGRGIMSD